MSIRSVLAGMILVATLLFGLVVATEWSSAEARPANGGSGHLEATTEGGEEGSAEEPHADEARSAETTTEGTILGIDPESWVVVAVVAVLSLALTAAVRLRAEWRWALPLTIMAMLAFAVFDGREVVHQLDESNAGRAVAALVVAVLHAAAAVAAFALVVRGLRERTTGIA